VTPHTEAVERAIDLVSRAEQRGASLRMVGGIAIAYLCGADRARGGDLDFVAGPRDRTAIEAVLTDSGFAPDREFNHLHGHRRLYFEALDGVPVDIFMGRMDMCHLLDLRGRLSLFSPTVPPVDLVLSKLQIVEFTEKDHRDTRALLERLDVDDRHDAIDTRRVQEVTCADWGWHRTVSQNLERFIPGSDVVGRKAGELLELMSAWPKTRRWNLRARVGTRKRWYRLPEEVAHGSTVGGA
jgi:hypothetical protein